MQPWELFKEIKKAKYKTVGLNLDYSVSIIDGHACLFFQSSRQNSDWLYNFCFVRKVYKHQEHHMVVHGGFAKVWKSANDEIMKEFINAVEITTKLPVIAGWSFGGAMSVLAAEDFNYRTERRPFVVTFGAPKVAGDKKTARYIKGCADFEQFAEYNDIVTYMPPLPGFKHIDIIRVGDRFNLIEIFKPQIHHAQYSKASIY